MSKKITIFDKIVSEEGVLDLVEDIFYDARKLDLPADKDGFCKGMFRLCFEFIPDEDAYDTSES